MRGLTRGQKTVAVKATSYFGAAAALNCEFFLGKKNVRYAKSMTYDGANNIWSVTFSPISSPPATVTVYGPEGSASKSVTTIK